MINIPAPPLGVILFAMGFLSCLLLATSGLFGRELGVMVPAAGGPVQQLREFSPMLSERELEAGGVAGDMLQACEGLGTCRTLGGTHPGQTIVLPKRNAKVPGPRPVQGDPPWLVALGRNGGVPAAYGTICAELHASSSNISFNSTNPWAGRYHTTNCTLPLAGYREIYGQFPFLPTAVTGHVDFTGHVWHATLFAWPAGGQFPHTRGILWDYVFNESVSHPTGRKPGTVYWVTETVIGANVSAWHVPALSVRTYEHEAGGYVRPATAPPANNYYENFLTHPGNTVLLKNAPGTHTPAYGYVGPMPGGVCTMRVVYWVPAVLPTPLPVAKNTTGEL